jgi:hypothetical protein
MFLFQWVTLVHIVFNASQCVDWYQHIDVKRIPLARLNIDTIHAHTFEQAICGQITMLMNMEQTTMPNWRIS